MILANPQQLLQGLNAKLIEALQPSSSSLVARLSTYVNSTAAFEEYAWLGEVQQVLLWDGEVEFDSITETSGRGLLATNLKYTGGLQIKRDDLADEKTGGLAQRILDLVARISMHADEQLATLLINGGSTATYDGSNLFTTTHTGRGAAPTQSNQVTFTGSTTAAVSADLNSALAALYNMLDEAGKPINRGYSKFFLMYPPALNKAISESTVAAVIAQTSNVQFRNVNFDLIEEPLISSASGGSDVTYYVGIQDAPVRGVIYQERETPSFEALEMGSGSDLAFVKEVNSYKVRKRSVAVPARWQRIVKVV